MITVTITGPQGSGKTRLAKALRTCAVAMGISVRIFESNDPNATGSQHTYSQEGTK